MGTVTVTAAGSIESTGSSGSGGIGVGRTVNASSTLALADANTEINCAHATVAIVLTIPNDTTVAWVDGTVITAYQSLAAACSFTAGAGVTLRSPTGAATSTQYADIGIKKVGPNEWRVLR